VRTTTGAGLCVLAMTILGSSVTFSRAIVDYPPLTGQAARYAVAAVLLFGLSTMGARGPRPGPRDLAILTALAATGLAAFNLCILIGLRHADPAVVGTVIGAAPLGLAVSAPLLRRDRPSGVVVAAAAVIVAGIVIVYGGGSSDAIGLLAAFGAFLGEVLFSLLADAVLPRLGAIRTSAYSCALAVPLLLLSALVVRESPRAPTLTQALTLAYLATALTVGAFLAWFNGLRRLGVDRAGLFVGVLPVSTLVVTGLVDHRLPGLARSGGVLLVAAGLALGLIRRGPATMLSQTARPGSADRRDLTPPSPAASPRSPQASGTG
jgi:drug/metabolite transporter (DMT)-like permease